MVRVCDWQLSDRGFESCWGRLETLAIYFTPLCQCLSEETLKVVGPFYLVSMPGEVKDPTSLHWKCVTCRGLHHPLLGRVHTTLFRTGHDRSRPVRAQLPVSTWEQPERSFRFLETTSRYGTSGRDRSRSVAPCQLCRVDARPARSR